MQIEPSADAFAARYAAGEAQVVWTTLVADLETPVSAFLKIAGGRPMSFLLESVEGGAVRGRYSVIGLEPDVICRSNGARGRDQPNAAHNPEAFAPAREPPLQALRALIAESRIALPDALPPMAAGVFGYLGYDTVRLMEERCRPPPDPIGIPDAVLMRPTLVVVFDAVKDTITVVTPVRPRAGITREGRACARRTSACRRSSMRSTGRSTNLPRRSTPARSTSCPARTRRPRNSSAWCCAPRNTSPPATFFRWCCRSASRRRSRLRRSRSIARCGASIRRLTCIFLDCGTFAVAGSSPEILVKTTAGTVTIRPVAGTRRRGATPHEDKALEQELLADPKERAEHLMLLDLGRNDVGRVAEIGSVEVTDQFFIERYSQVMHIVSNVQGKLAAIAMRSTRSPPVFRPAPSPARRRCAPCRSSMNWRRKSAGFMPAASAIFRPPPTWTPASCCAPR